MKQNTKKIFMSVALFFIIEVLFFVPYKSEKLDNLLISLISGLILILFVIFTEMDFSKPRKFVTKLFNSKSH